MARAAFIMAVREAAKGCKRAQVYLRTSSITLPSLGRLPGWANSTLPPTLHTLRMVPSDRAGTIGLERRGAARLALAPAVTRRCLVSMASCCGRRSTPRQLNPWDRTRDGVPLEAHPETFQTVADLV